MLFSIISLLAQLLSGSSSTIKIMISNYGYLAIFGLMALEGSTLPIPSEVVLPLAGYFVFAGVLSFPLALIAALAGSALGLAVDYYIAYFLGKEIVYKHLQRFHIKKESLDSFDNWFERNGIAAVFMTRLIPVIRTIMSFPAGFAKMDPRKFFGYSILGSLIWDSALITFGYYALSTNNIVITLTAIGVFGIVLYVVYRTAMKRMKGST